MVYVILIIEQELYLEVIPNNDNLTLPLVKVCNLLIKRLLNFSYLCAKCNLITTDLVSSNNYFGINNSFFVESENRIIDEVNRITSM